MTQTTEIDTLVESGVRREKWAVARLIRLFEDGREAAIEQRRDVMAHFEAIGCTPHAFVVGVTGTPGAGKSSLLGELARRLVEREPELSVVILAIDPSSQRSGGAILGDRTRVRFPVDDRRLYFRSQASEQNLGGIGAHTYPVVRLLERLFDVVFVETVGIGQSEIEVERVSDRLYLVLQPLGGDQVQFMKAGIMEVPDVFVLNKADTGVAARRTFYMLRTSIDFVRPGEATPPPIIRTSAVTGEGLDALVEDVLGHRADREPAEERAAYFLRKWVMDEYGRLGVALLAEQGGETALLRTHGSFEAAQAAYRPPVAPTAERAPSSV